MICLRSKTDRLCVKPSRPYTFCGWPSMHKYHWNCASKRHEHGLRPCSKWQARSGQRYQQAPINGPGLRGRFLQPTVSLRLASSKDHSTVCLFVQEISLCSPERYSQGKRTLIPSITLEPSCPFQKYHVMHLLVQFSSIYGCWPEGHCGLDKSTLTVDLAST